MKLNKFPLISIVIPSFNQGNYIEQTIISIIEQDYEHKEIIIIDGGSTDNTVNILKKYNSKITYWISEKDNGQSHAINKGLKIAKGEIFNWINSDDYLEPGALKHIATLFQAKPDLNIVGGYCRLFSEKEKFSIISRIGIKESAEESIVNYWMNQPSTFYKTEIIKDFGGINESLHYCMDLEIWFKYLSKYGTADVKLTNNLLSHFRHHDSSKTETLNHNFILEYNSLIKYITHKLKFPRFVVSEFTDSKYEYKPKKEWEIKHLNKNNFAESIAKKYHHKFYSNNNYKALRWALMNLIINKDFKLNRYYLSLLHKSLINR